MLSASGDDSNIADSIVHITPPQNVAYYAVLPLDRIANFASGDTVEGFATDFAHVTMGLAGQIILPLLVAASAAGAANGGAAATWLDVMLIDDIVRHLCWGQGHVRVRQAGRFSSHIPAAARPQAPRADARHRVPK